MLSVLNKYFPLKIHKNVELMLSFFLKNHMPKTNLRIFATADYLQLQMASVGHSHISQSIENLDIRLKMH